MASWARRCAGSALGYLCVAVCMPGKLCLSLCVRKPRREVHARAYDEEVAWGIVELMARVAESPAGKLESFVCESPRALQCVRTRLEGWA